MCVVAPPEGGGEGTQQRLTQDLHLLLPDRVVPFKTSSSYSSSSPSCLASRLRSCRSYCAVLLSSRRGGNRLSRGDGECECSVDICHHPPSHPSAHSLKPLVLLYNDAKGQRGVCIVWGHKLRPIPIVPQEEGRRNNAHQSATLLWRHALRSALLRSPPGDARWPWLCSRAPRRSV